MHSSQCRNIRNAAECAATIRQFFRVAFSHASISFLILFLVSSLINHKGTYEIEEGCTPKITGWKSMGKRKDEYGRRNETGIKYGFILILHRTVQRRMKKVICSFFDSNPHFILLHVLLIVMLSFGKEPCSTFWFAFPIIYFYWMWT